MLASTRKPSNIQYSGLVVSSEVLEKSFLQLTKATTTEHQTLVSQDEEENYMYNTSSKPTGWLKTVYRNISSLLWYHPKFTFPWQSVRWMLNDQNEVGMIF